jgi:hypothetical protein
MHIFNKMKNLPPAKLPYTAISAFSHSEEFSQVISIIPKILLLILSEVACMMLFGCVEKKLE